MGKKKKKKTERLTRSEAIKAKCKECCGTMQEVRKCPITECPLWRYRVGEEIRDSLYIKSKRGRNLSIMHSKKKSASTNRKKISKQNKIVKYIAGLLSLKFEDL